MKEHLTESPVLTLHLKARDHTNAISIFHGTAFGHSAKWP